MRIIPILYGRSTLGEHHVFENGSREKKYPIDFVVYYVEAEGRRILIDAGCDTMPNFNMVDFIGPVAALKAHGINAEEITDLVITHSHHDHIEGVKHFTNATVYLQKEEYEKGKKYIPEGFPVVLFEEGLQLCQEVEIVKIGGHSKGSSVVEIIGKNQKSVVCGDECYSPRCLEEGILTGSTVSPEKSRAFLQKYGTGEYLTLLCHQMPALKNFYKEIIMKFQSKVALITGASLSTIQVM